ncbi:alpha/beta fold hydrolase [Microbacterium sp. SORGH_AS_0421]|uniref:alpha/beta fold hydrolase n=1 Tax=Microbacterium sp. SORGH_AS_0421 TaxID=3041768 RepID=UPI0027D8F354|nr:alpha/beta hydrolase [Microbacterium sp. SORGH_AS_0421]
MDVILVPGLWLDASSWDDITPALEAADHRPHPLTLPGPAVGDLVVDDWVDAVVAEIDRIGGRVILVGHSGGGNVVWGAADRRPDQVARVILVDTIVPHPGAMISEFPSGTVSCTSPGGTSSTKTTSPTSTHRRESAPRSRSSMCPAAFRARGSP